MFPILIAPYVKHVTKRQSLKGQKKRMGVIIFIRTISPTKGIFIGFRMASLFIKCTNIGYLISKVLKASGK
jgi:hypothetical protein